MKNEITKAFSNEQKEARRKGTCVPQGRLEHIIKEHKTKYQLPDAQVTPWMVCSRIRRKNLIVDHAGLKSPMLQVESQLATLCCQMAAIRQPISCSTGLMLTNLLIAGTQIGSEVKEWLKHHSFHYDRSDGEDDLEEQILG